MFHLSNQNVGLSCGGRSRTACFYNSLLEVLTLQPPSSPATVARTDYRSAELGRVAKKSAEGGGEPREQPQKGHYQWRAGENSLGTAESTMAAIEPSTPPPPRAFLISQITHPDLLLCRNEEHFQERHAEGQSQKRAPSSAPSSARRHNSPFFSRRRDGRAPVRMLQTLTVWLPLFFFFWNGA